MPKPRTSSCFCTGPILGGLSTHLSSSVLCLLLKHTSLIASPYHKMYVCVVLLSTQLLSASWQLGSLMRDHKSPLKHIHTHTHHYIWTVKVEGGWWAVCVWCAGMASWWVGVWLHILCVRAWPTHMHNCTHTHTLTALRWPDKWVALHIKNR